MTNDVSFKKSFQPPGQISFVESHSLRIQISKKINQLV